ncbi:MAG: hypothetical protein AB4041_01420 [Microcystaceae cyanobacterium]
MVLGFMLAAYGIVANDAIQTLGTFLSSNRERPWWLLWLYACGILTVVFLLGWIFYQGDISYGRLEKFPLPHPFTWIYLIPPLTVLLLTNFGIPVSTTFLILTVFNPDNLGNMLTKSLVGYGVAFMVSILIYNGLIIKLEQSILEKSLETKLWLWIILQWISTGFLWSQWLIQDLANIFAYLPRHLSLLWLLFSLIIMFLLHAILFYRHGGEIQQIINSKTNSQDIRSATLINFIFGLILLIFKEYSKMPMSTTWVFIGLLAGRELAITFHLKHHSLSDTGKLVFKDGIKALIGLGVSVAIALTLPYLT